ncbi:MAG: hypothetical protein GY927_10925 [bacterium]|nr:hypothetical protein [bacterium]
MPSYTIHHSTTGKTQQFDDPVDVLEAWTQADANTKPCLIVINDDSSVRLAAITTIFTDAHGKSHYVKSPHDPDLEYRALNKT